MQFDLKLKRAMVETTANNDFMSWNILDTLWFHWLFSFYQSLLFHWLDISIKWSPVYIISDKLIEV